LASYNNFQNDNNKNSANRSTNDPANNTNVEMITEEQLSEFLKNIDKYAEFLSWARWYPDLFLDMISPRSDDGKIKGLKLHFDQRIFLRCTVRFYSMYGVFSRGYAKTFNEILSLNVLSILFPGITLSVTAQTKENAAEILADKQREIFKFYPIIKDEVVKYSFTKNDADVLFKNESRIDILANAQTSKGQRRRRINIEEAALLDNKLFEDALEPIVEIGRTTVGNLGVVDPVELNQCIHFFTTAGFRNSDEFHRSLKMVEEMENLEGKIVLGANWMLPCWYGRGSSKTKILKKKQTMSPISFAQNYGQRWVGATDGALVDINQLMRLRHIEQAESKPEMGYEYIMAVDVARSEKSSNNRSSAAVIKLVRRVDGSIKFLEVVNIIDISNALSFTNQAIEVKKIKNKYNAKIVIVDSNGLGTGLVDELLKQQFDPSTGRSLGCWNTINTTNKPESFIAEDCLYDLKPQSAQSDILVAFSDAVTSGQLALLIKKIDAGYDVDDQDGYNENMLPFIQTNFFIEEVANLKVKLVGKNNSLGIEQAVKGTGKDRFSAVSYAVWYARNFMEREIDEDPYDNLEDYFFDGSYY